MEWNETDSSLRNRVPTNELDSDDEQNTSKDAESIEDKPKQRGKSRPYEKIIQFEDFDSAKKYMEEREDYTYRYIRESHVEGDKLWYTCSNNNKCPKTIYLHMHIDSLICSIHQSSLEHNHENFDHKSRLPKASVEYIKEQLKLGTRKNDQLFDGLLLKGYL